MRELIVLAKKAEGKTRTNPLVAAGLERDGEWLACDFHPAYGEGHAEARLFESYSGHLKGARLYSTLEPCIHPGKTPACLDRLVERGLEQIVISMEDPHPAVNGAGIHALRALGLNVETGIETSLYRWINRAYFHGVESGNPWIDIKWAVSADGYIAPPSGESRWITGEESRARGHRLRAHADAVMVGAETVRRDDPQLTNRVTEDEHQPRAIVVSRTPSNLPDDSWLFRERPAQTTLIVPADVEPSSVEIFRQRGINLLKGDMVSDRFDWDSILPRLRKRGIARILVEGGGFLIGSLIESGYGCEYHGFYSGRLLGDGTRSIQFSEGPHEVKKAPETRLLDIETMGNDVYIRRLGEPRNQEIYEEGFFRMKEEQS